MPIEYRIDHARRLVLAHGQGVVTHRDFYMYQRHVWSNPDVDGYNELMDMTDVTTIDLSAPENIRQLAELGADMDNPFMPSKLAILAPGDEAFGLGRMYQTHRSLAAGATKSVGVFRSRAEAFAFLGIPDPR